jgi:hypothetical protein
MTIETPSYTGPDRRKHLPTMELWQENIKALNQAGLTNCQMRYALNEGAITFIVRFENDIPTGSFDFTFPELDKTALTEAGWEKFVLTILVNDEGKLNIQMWGHYARDEVPLDVRMTFERDIGLGVGVLADEVLATDERTAETVKTTFADLLAERLKDGEPRYARKDDDVSNISVEGMISILGRYLKQLAVSRRVLPR